MKKIFVFSILVSAAVVMIPLSSAFAVFNYPTGTTFWDPDRAYNGYTAYCDGDKGWLIDMEGRVVNSWSGVDAAPNGYMFLLENGRWRTAPTTSYAPGGALQAGGGRGRLEEYDWDGNRLWWWDAFNGVVSDGEGGYGQDPMSATFRFHHDWQRIYNSTLGEWTYMVLLWVSKDETDADNLGVDPALNGPSRAMVDNPATPGVDESLLATWSPCALIEVRPLYNVTDNTALNNNSA